jgi:hypothetical protein
MSPRVRLWMLALLGLLSGLCYYVLISAALVPYWGLSFNVRGTKYGGPLTWPARLLDLAHLPRTERPFVFVLLMVALVCLWVVAIYLVRRDRRKAVTIVIAAAFGLFALIFVFTPTFMSRDVFSYIFYGRAMSVYHANPFVLIPHARQSDIFYPLIGWKYNASVYGPVFNYLSWLVTKIAGNNIAANVLGFKVMAFSFYAACLPMVYWIARRLTPGKENMALAITAWCPILVMHTLGGAHNDLIMVAFVLAGYLLYRKGYLLTGIAIVAVAVAVKVIAVFALAPMLVLYVRDKRGAPLKRLVAGVAACVGVVVVLYIPFLKSLNIFKATSRMSSMYSTSSVPKIFSWLYVKAFGGGAAANSRAHLLFLGIAAILGILLLLKVKDYRSMTLCASSLVLVWFLTSTYVLPWYLALGLVMAALTGWNATTGALVAAAAIFSLYHIPTTKGGGPVFYLGIPLLVVLVIWTVLFGSSELKLLRWHMRKSRVSQQQEDLVPEEA